MHRSLYKVNDEYYTPDWVWCELQPYLSPQSVLWEPFPGNGQSVRCLRGMGYTVHSENKDFFTCSSDLSKVIVTNPPFSRIREILVRLVSWKQPFFMVMPMSRLNVKYFREIMSPDMEHFKLLIPSRRIDFDRPANTVSRCPFECGIYAYRIDSLETKSGLIWLDSNTTPVAAAL